jgi:hypothetical protein
MLNQNMGGSCQPFAALEPGHSTIVLPERFEIRGRRVEAMFGGKLQRKGLRDRWQTVPVLSL